jgi:hypothetical protein
VKLSELDALLPAETARVDPVERRQEIARRQAHIAWRYRT